MQASIVVLSAASFTGPLVTRPLAALRSAALRVCLHCCLAMGQV